ncbi:hypothetical protein LMBV_009 [Largemouth bass virus]|uniref:Uncharacterized protein n=1 Tax=Largemouth bass virus TaxID=176656 RepID=A0A9X7TN62_9VIRU|nr:hypothetical protein LMBV_009 [Largemouth bass virus]QJE49158.1 hypothetical protein LMBV_009 [Largemouth bass virus]
MFKNMALRIMEPYGSFLFIEHGEQGEAGDMGEPGETRVNPWWSLVLAGTRVTSAPPDKRAPGGRPDRLDREAREDRPDRPDKRRLDPSGPEEIRAKQGLREE